MQVPSNGARRRPSFDRRGSHPKPAMSQLQRKSALYSTSRCQSHAIPEVFLAHNDCHLFSRCVTSPANEASTNGRQNLDRAQRNRLTPPVSGLITSLFGSVNRFRGGVGARVKTPAMALVSTAAIRIAHARTPSNTSGFCAAREKTASELTATASGSPQRTHQGPPKCRRAATAACGTSRLFHAGPLVLLPH